jgi:hypothetical protein
LILTVDDPEILQTEPAQQNVGDIHIAICNVDTGIFQHLVADCHSKKSYAIVRVTLQIYRNGGDCIDNHFVYYGCRYPGHDNILQHKGFLYQPAYFIAGTVLCTFKCHHTFQSVA